MSTNTPMEFYIVTSHFNMNPELLKMKVHFLKVLEGYENMWETNSEHNANKILV